MSKKTNHIDQIARQKLIDAKVDPPMASWDRLREDMDKTNSRKRFFHFTKLSAAAAGILILLSLGIVYLTTTKIEDPIANIPTQIDSTKNELEKMKSIKLKSEIEISPKNELALNINQIKFEKTPKTSFTNELKITYLKLVEFIYPIEIHSQQPTLIAQNDSWKKNETYFDWSEYKYSESNKVDPKNEKNWELGLAYSPSYASSNAPSNDFNTFYAGLDATTASNEINVNEELLPSFTFGANFSYNLSDRWSLISGIYYLKHKNEIQNFYIIENTINSETTLSTNSSIGNILISNRELISRNASFSNQIELSTFSNISNYNSDLIQQFEFVEIPLLISYKLINKKWTISLITGLNAGFMVGNNVYMKDFETENDKLGSTDDVNTMSLKSVIGFSFEYPLSKRLFLSISPTYKYQISNINKVATNNYHFKFIDFKTGISYHF